MTIVIKERKLNKPEFMEIDVEYTDDKILEIFKGYTADTHITLALLRRAVNAENRVKELEKTVLPICPTCKQRCTVVSCARCGNYVGT